MLLHHEGHGARRCRQRKERDLLKQQVERNILEVLISSLTKVHFLLPSIVLSDDQGSNPMLNAVLDQELGDVMEVVFKTEVTLLGTFLGRVLVEPLIERLCHSTIDQYGRMLV